MADPDALPQAVAAKDAVAFIGYPECKLALAQCVVYLALAPKSNSVYKAYDEAARTATHSPPYPVPLVIRNAPTRLMKELGHGDGYRYAHDEDQAYAAGESYWPEELEPRTYYEPAAQGLEVKIRDRLARLKGLDGAAGKRRG